MLAGPSWWNESRVEISHSNSNSNTSSTEAKASRASAITSVVALWQAGSVSCMSFC